MAYPPSRRSRSSLRTVVLGVTGLPASGKSTIAGMFRALGAEVADADRLAHEALGVPSVRRGVARAFGREVLTPAGAVDRAAMAARVFGRGEDRGLGRLMALVHPVVLRGLRAGVARARRRRAPAVVLDIPLLFESGLQSMCDATVFVDAPRAARVRRAAGRGWTATELRAREARQSPAAARRRKADFVVRNDGDRAAARRAVGRIWRQAVSDGGRRS